jgi:hypothetical protein
MIAAQAAHSRSQIENSYLGSFHQGLLQTGSFICPHATSSWAGWCVDVARGTQCSRNLVLLTTNQHAVRLFCQTPSELSNWPRLVAAPGTVKEVVTTRSQYVVQAGCTRIHC